MTTEPETPPAEASDPLSLESQLAAALARVGELEEERLRAWAEVDNTRKPASSPSTASRVTFCPRPTISPAPWKPRPPARALSNCKPCATAWRWWSSN
jgi:hypothetical protein